LLCKEDINRRQQTGMTGRLKTITENLENYVTAPGVDALGKLASPEHRW
jgi:hypothetical protein